MQHFIIGVRVKPNDYMLDTAKKKTSFLPFSFLPILHQGFKTIYELEH